MALPLFFSCSSKYEDEKLEIIRREIKAKNYNATPNRYLEVKKEDISYEIHSGLYFIKWSYLESKLRWDFIIPENLMYRNSRGSIKLDSEIELADTSILNKLFVLAKDNKYYIERISQISKQRYRVLIGGRRDGGLVSEQSYSFEGSSWVLDSTYSFYSGYKECDLNKTVNSLRRSNW